LAIAVWALASAVLPPPPAAAAPAGCAAPADVTLPDLAAVTGTALLAVVPGLPAPAAAAAAGFPAPAAAVFYGTAIFRS